MDFGLKIRKQITMKTTIYTDEHVKAKNYQRR
jgi:hypothetical protein